MQRVPDFIGIGVIKCGTTWTYNQLLEHPQIAGSNKELHFFDWQKYTPSEYKSLFGKLDKDKIVGEWTPEYFTAPGVPERIKKFCPNAKLLCILRNPIDRAWSNFKSAKYQKHIPEKTCFRDAFFKGFPKRNKESTLKARGLYAKHLKRWFEHFKNGEICILFYDDMVRSPVAYMKKVYSFLGVDPNFVSPTVHQYFKRPYNDYYKDLKMSKNVRRQVREFYEPSIGQLEKLLGKDLSHWKSIR